MRRGENDLRLIAANGPLLRRSSTAIAARPHRSRSTQGRPIDGKSPHGQASRSRARRRLRVSLSRQPLTRLTVGASAFVTNPASSAIVNATGPIRQLVQSHGTEAQRALIIAPGPPNAPGALAQVQQAESEVRPTSESQKLGTSCATKACLAISLPRSAWSGLGVVFRLRRCSHYMMS
jgi:hypothetical protein